MLRVYFIVLQTTLLRRGWASFGFPNYACTLELYRVITQIWPFNLCCHLHILGPVILFYLPIIQLAGWNYFLCKNLKWTCQSCLIFVWLVIVSNFIFSVITQLQSFYFAIFEECDSSSFCVKYSTLYVIFLWQVVRSCANARRPVYLRLNVIAITGNDSVLRLQVVESHFSIQLHINVACHITACFITPEVCHIRQFKN